MDRNRINFIQTRKKKHTFRAFGLSERKKKLNESKNTPRYYIFRDGMTISLHKMMLQLKYLNNSTVRWLSAKQLKYKCPRTQGRRQV